MVIKISDKQISDSFASISKDVQVILTSEIVKEELQKMLQSYTMTPEKERLFFREILSVVLSLSSKKDFLEKTEEIFQISTTKAQVIVSGVNGIVFKRIKKVQEGLSSDYLNIDNNIDHFSNNSKYILELPDELKENLKSNEKMNYNSYQFIKSNKTIF